MADTSATPAVSGAVILEEVEGGGEPVVREGASPPESGELHCGGCALLPRQQTWLCVVPLLIGFIGLGLSLMLLKWIVVGFVQDYVPTDLVDAKVIGQDPIFLSKPGTLPKSSDTSTTADTTATIKGRPRLGTPSSTTTARAGVSAAAGSQVTPHSTTGIHSRTSTVTLTAPTSKPSPSNPTILHNSTQMWTHARASQRPSATSTGSHGYVNTPSPTTPPLRSEHFKPCKEKDLAYCLNEGECFIIETLTGLHKHCRCKEGYQGVRCDQFLPKTDSILSDSNLGIEFMETEEVYKRQVSISCIAIGISLLGTLCIVFYCRNKRQRGMLKSHPREGHSKKNYSTNISDRIPKTNVRPQYGLQLQKSCRGHRPSPANRARFSQSSAALPIHAKTPAKGKHHRHQPKGAGSDHQKDTHILNMQHPPLSDSG